MPLVTSNFNYKYPTDIESSGMNFIRISAFKKDRSQPQGSVSFYSPAGIGFSDGAGFSTFDLGPIGSQIVNALSAPGETSANVKNAVDAGLSSLSNKDSGLGQMLAGKILASAAGAFLPGVSMEAARAGYEAKQGRAVNPNTITAFQNMTIRNFVFNFKLIAESPEESGTIRGIQDFFRMNMYPETKDDTGYILAYPSTFHIRFYLGDGSRNPWIPKIYQCYLTNMSTTFNPSSHLTHHDGAPTEIDFSLTFQETKVLTANDISAMEQEAV